MVSSTSSLEVGLMKNIFLLFLPENISKAFLEVGIFSTSLEAIDVKKLLNWLAIKNHLLWFDYLFLREFFVIF